jgi:CRISPR/Cas system CMR-associated protein Cmr5 small subunit
MDGFIQWSPGVSLEALEKQAIQKAFMHFQENKQATANALGITVDFLESKLEKYQQQDINESEKEFYERSEREQFLRKCRGENTPDNLVTERSEREAKARREGREQENNGADAGIRVEPAVDDRQEPSLSVSKRKEIQKVSPKSSSKGNTKRNGRKAS